MCACVLVCEELQPASEDVHRIENTGIEVKKEKLESAGALNKYSQTERRTSAVERIMSALKTAEKGFQTAPIIACSR